MNIIACTPRPLTERPPALAAAPAGGWPRVSIITPTLNRGDLIETAIRSVAAQDYPLLEHIIVDGGSTDDTLARLARYPNLRVISEPDGGSHQAMNKGLALALGDIIGFLNSDDLYAPGILKAAARAVAGGARLVAGRCFLVAPAGDGALQVSAELRHFAEPDRYLDELMYATPGFNAYFFDRRLFDELGSFEPRFDVAADRDFLLRAAYAGHRPVILDQPGYYYQWHDSSRTLDPGGRLGDRILRDHLAIADRDLAAPSLDRALRGRVLRWRAYEAGRSVLRGVLSRRCAEAGGAARAASRADVLWPFRFVAAWWRVRRLGRILRRTAGIAGV